MEKLAYSVKEAAALLRTRPGSKPGDPGAAHHVGGVAGQRRAEAQEERGEQAVRYDGYGYDDVLYGAGTGIVYVGHLEERASQVGARPCKVCGAPTLNNGVCRHCRRRGAELRARLYERRER